MSEIQNNGIPLKKIVAPSLNQSNYAENLSGTFDNIDKNFSTLANYDFIKGESGESIRIEEVSFFNEDGTLNEYGKKIHKYFEDNFSEEITRDITVNEVTISLFENFTPKKAGNLFLITTTYNDVDNTSVPVSSLYYVFLDGRFSNGKFAKDKVEEETYNDIEDLSCILVYDKDTAEFKSLNNAFPTMYYEKNVGLCWKVNGNETGIPVKGQRGDDGKDAMLYFVKCERAESDNEIYVKSKVVGIYNYPVTTPIEDISDDEKQELNNCSSLILLEDDTKHYMYFGQLVYEDKEVFAYYYNNMELTYNMQTTDFINVLKGINITSPDFNPLRGLFIPMEAENKDEAQSVHFMGATSIMNQIGDQLDGKRTDLILTPINDINDFDVTSDPGEQLLVEKYLYVKFDKNNYLTSYAYVDDSIYDTEKHKSIYSTLNKLDYTLKYKLEKVYNNIHDFNYVSGSELYPNFGYIKFKGTNKNIDTFNGVHILYKDNTNTVVSANCIERPEVASYSLPKKLKEKLNAKQEIYRWTLCSDQHEFDAELLNGKNGDKFTYDTHTNTHFKYIFTSTPTPTIISEIAWFNSLEVAYFYKNDNGINRYINVFDDLSYVNDTYTPVLYGWGDVVERENITDERETPFSFIKFIPVFNNDFKYNDETTLNVNYNINITGDVDSNNKRNININGDLNCDNLSLNNINISSIAEINEIKNIYTKNSAVIDGGIKIGENNNMYNATIDSSGNALLKDLKTHRITSTNINTTDINSTDITTKKLNISSGTNNLLTANIEITGTNNIVLPDNPEHNIPQNPGSTPKSRTDNNGNAQINVKDYSLTINADKAKFIDINKFDDLSVITNNLPIINHEDSNIILSNDIDFAKNINEKTKSESLRYSDFANIINVVKEEIDKNSYESTKQETIYGNFSYTLPKTVSELCTTYNNFLIYKNINKDNTIRGEVDNNKDIFEYIIKRPTENYTFNSSNDIKITFDKYLMFIMAIHSDGAVAWNRPYDLPFLNKNSYVTLNVFYQIDDDVKDAKANISLSFDYNSYLYPHFPWTGVDIHGNIINDNGNNDFRVRYQSFIFKPDTICINDLTVLNDIETAYNNGKEIKIIIRPTSVIEYNCKGSKKLKEMMVTNIVPVTADYIYNSNKNVVSLTKNTLYATQYSTYYHLQGITSGRSCIYAFSENHDKHAFNWESNDNTANNTSKLSYDVTILTNKENNNNMTYLSRDGILFTHGSNLFGFGYYNDYIQMSEPEPCIIYYDKNSAIADTQIKKISDLFN